MGAAAPPLVFYRHPLAGRLPPFGPKARAAALALGAVTLWATWPALATVASPAPPQLLFGLAATCGFVVAFALAALQGRAASFFATSPATLLLVAMGLLVNNILYLLAMPRIGAAEANVIAYLWPVLLVMILARLRSERLSGLRMAGVALAFAGAALAIGPAFDRGVDPAGVLLAFSSGLTFAVYAAIRSYGREEHDVIGPSMGQAALLALSLHVVFEPPASLTPNQWLAIAGIGIAPLTLSNALWDRSIRTDHSAMVSALAYLTPLAALLLFALFGVGTVSVGVAAGAVLVVMGALTAAGLLQRGAEGR